MMVRSSIRSRSSMRRRSPLRAGRNPTNRNSSLGSPAAASAASIADAQEILGDRPACIAREVTKLHEEFLRGKLSQLAQSLAERPARGEITLLVGSQEQSGVNRQIDSTQSLSDRVDELIRQAKLDRKDALKLAAKERGITRRAAYDQLIDSKAKPN